MKGWIYVITNQAVRGLVRVGVTPKDPVAFAEALDKGGLPFPYEVGYEALVPDMDAADKAVAATLADRSQGKGWYSCSVVEAVRQITRAVSGSILVESRYDNLCLADRMYEAVSSSDSVRRREVLSDPQCPPNVFRFAVEREEDESVLLSMLANPSFFDIDLGIVDLFPRVAKFPTILEVIAENPRVPPSVLEMVFASIDESQLPLPVILKLIRNTSFSADNLSRVVEKYKNEKNVLRVVLERTDCLPHAVSRIAWIDWCDCISSEPESIHELAKTHPAWSVEEFVSLLENEAKFGDSPDMVAAHRACPPELLEWLFRSGDRSIKEMVLYNDACPPNLLVNVAIAGSIEDFAGDEERCLADLAMEHPLNPIVRASKADSEVEFRALARYQYVQVLLPLAKNPACPAGVLNEIATSWSSDVREAVAAHSLCPSDTLCFLARDESDVVRARVAERQDCPSSILINLAHDRAPKVVGEALMNPGCPPEILKDYAESEYFEFRLLVLDNPSCPVPVVDLLRKDRNRDVRKKAKSRYFGAGEKCP